MKVTGNLKPLRDNVFVSDMDFGSEVTSSGIYIPSSDGKSDGIVPRWGKVWAVGPDQTEVSVGQWVCIEHGRWTRGITVEQDTGEDVIVRMVDNKDIMLVSDEKPETFYRRSD
jgi:co-chaperonin GroES (HSP10)